MTDPVVHSRVEDGILQIEMRDAEGKNALSRGFVDQLVAALEIAHTKRDVRVTVLGGLDEIFCSGAPRELLLELVDGALLPADIALTRSALAVPVPLVTVMKGHATGGGLALGLCGDMVLMAEDSRYGCTFMNMGFTPGMGSTFLLEHVMSPALAHELLYTGELRRGSEFRGCAGVNAILPKNELDARARDLATRIAEKPRPALEKLKRSLSLGRRQAFERGLTLESLMHESSFSDPAVRRRIEDDFHE